jgi:tRNA uridine 5-carboxymethylaminomethyl modification enzyme
MFTSRAEFRLTLRADNADLRLTEKGIGWGCVGSTRAAAFSAHKRAVTDAMERAAEDGGQPTALARHGVQIRTDGGWRSVSELLGYDGIDFDALALAFPWLRQVPARAMAQVRTEARYAGYLPRQQADIRAFQREEAVELAGVTFQDIGGLSTELRDKLLRHEPPSLGAAARIQGMTPAALAAIAAHVRKRRAA